MIITSGFNVYPGKWKLFNLPPSRSPGRQEAV